MMNADQKMKGWKMFLNALFLGPFFLIHYFRENRRDYPVVRYLAWSSFPVLVICAWLMFTFTFSPFIVRGIYCVVFLSIFGLTFISCWVQDSKINNQIPDQRSTKSFSRAIAWMIVMGVLFQGCNNLAQSFYFWVLGEQVSVYYSGQANVFDFWFLIGLIYGFLYGMKKTNDYFTRDMLSVVKSIVFILMFVFIFNGLILLLGIYPLQRLAPVSYRPQVADFLFYFLFFMAISLGGIYLMKTVHRNGYMKSTLNFVAGILLIAFHVIVVSAYATTINLTIASILEDRGELESAKTLYARTIPYISYDHLLASLHHRQGVLNVLNNDYVSALASFKRVIADYSEEYDVYKKALKYVDSYEQSGTMDGLGRNVLSVRHQTFEQAASCFPNSLSVILNFYAEQPVSTRKVSYAIKEAFSSGTFIWKAESFLRENNYRLITTFWQDKAALIALLDAGYPVLLYVPGHVYTLYGYDTRMEMFFTYDTAKSNRWNDKPFDNLQRNWMKSSFLMSVVVRDGEQGRLETLFPDLFNHSQAFKLWQKTQISDYYAQKDNYWKDYDSYKVSKYLGIDRLILGDDNFLSEDFYPYPWNAGKWNADLLPVLEHTWARDWSIAERCMLYLIYSGQPEQALDLIRQYQSRLSEEKLSTFPRLLELKLSAAAAAGNEQEVLSTSDKLIAISDNNKTGSLWGHYFKGRQLIDSGDFKSAADILLPALDNISLRNNSYKPTTKYIADALLEINQADPSLIDTENKALIEVVRVYLGSTKEEL